MNAKLLALLGCAILMAACKTPNSGQSKWQNLLGPQTTSHWRTFGGTTFPSEGWKVEGDILHLEAGGKGGDLVSVETFDDFEFEWEWKLAPRANNGVKYFVTESRPSAPGHEYQMVDDSTMSNLKHKTASFYDVLPPQVATHPKPIGEWNQSRIVVSGNHVEHWLNGEKVLFYELGSDAVKAALAESKFRNTPGFGEKISGRLMLTNHQDETWYRNLRIRKL